MKIDPEEDGEEEGESGDMPAQGSGQRPHSHRRERGPCGVLSAGTGIL